MLTTPLMQLMGVRYQGERLCEKVPVYVGFTGLKNTLTFGVLKQSTLLSGTL